jgi:DNA-binding MarR family transcriptional regulator
MARARRVTRQRIQSLVNALAKVGLVESISNPASKRSPLISLTQTGAGTIAQMRRAEGRNMQVDTGEEKLRAAARTLSHVREALEAGRKT